MRTAAVFITAAVLVGILHNAYQDGGDLVEGQWCDFYGERVQVLAVRPMGTSVTGATMISGKLYSRIVPRSDLLNCK